MSCQYIPQRWEWGVEEKEEYSNFQIGGKQKSFICHKNFMFKHEEIWPKQYFLDGNVFRYEENFIMMENHFFLKGIFLSHDGEKGNMNVEIYTSFLSVAFLNRTPAM